MNAGPTAADWLELFATLGLGGAVVVCMAALAERWIRSAVWCRTLWQTVTIALLVLLVGELTGASGALAHSARQCIANLAGSFRTKAHHGGPLRSGDMAGPAQQQEAFVSGQSAVLEVMPIEVTESDDHPLFADASDRVTESTLGPAPATPDALELAEPAVPGRMAGGDTNRLPVPLGWPGAVWIAGAALVAAWFTAARLILALCRRRRWSAAAPPLRERAAGLARRLGMRRCVTVVQARSLAGPIAFGMLRPTIVLPEQFDNQYDATQKDAILAHELAHLAAGDPAWYALSDLTAAALWWHPPVWWSRARLRAASELAADEASQVVADGPRVLAACLVELGGRLTTRPDAGWARMAGSGFRSGLGRRVEHLVQLDANRWVRPRRTTRWAATVIGVVLLLSAIFGGTTWARWNSFENGESTMNAMNGAWRKSVAGMLVVGALGWTQPATLPAQDEATSALPAANVPSDFVQDADDVSAKPQQADAAQDALDEEPTLHGPTEVDDSVVEITLTVDGQSAEAEAQVKQILELLSKANGVHVVVDTVDGRLDDANQPAKTAVRQRPKRDLGAVSIRVFRLKHRNPDEVTNIIGEILLPPTSEDAFGDFRVARVWPDPNQPRVVADQRTRSLLVRGTEAQLQIVANLVELLDTAEGQPAAKTDGLRAYQLRYAESREVAEVLRKLGIQLHIVADERLNRLLIAGTPEQIAEVEAVIKQLDVEASTPEELLGEVDDALLNRLMGLGYSPKWQVELEMTGAVIRVTESGQIQIGKKAVEPHQLGELIRGNERVQILADPAATYSKVQSVIDACRKAGARNVQVTVGKASEASDRIAPTRR